MTEPARARGRLRRTARAFGVFLLWFVPLETAAAAGRFEPWRPLPALGGMLLALVFLAALLLPLEPEARRRRATVGLRGLGGGWPWALLAAIAFAAYSWWTSVLSLLVSAPPPGQVPYPFADQPLGWLVLPVGVGVAAPLVEEFCLRGQLLPRLARIWGNPIALTAVSALFALQHGSRALLPYFFVGGLLLGYARLATGSIWAPVLAHAASNWWSVASMQGWVSVSLDLSVPALVALAAACAGAMVLLLRQAGRARRRGSRARAAATRAGRAPASAEVEVEVDAVAAEVRCG